MKFSICRREHQPADLRRAAGTKRIGVLVAVALIAVLLGFAGSAPTAAQSGQQSLTVDPSTVSEAGIYDFTLTPSGYTSSNVNLAICNTGDPNVDWGVSTLFQYCGGFGSKQDAMSGAFTVEGVQVGVDGVTFVLYELVSGGEGASATVNIEDSNTDGSSEAQTNTVTFSGTVTASGGISTGGVVVSVGAWCWDTCGSEVLSDVGSQRPRPLGPVEFLAEAGVDSSGTWSVTVSGVQAQNVRSVHLVAWDTNGQLASRFIDSETRHELWSWESLSGINVELEAGGRVSGSFADSMGGPPPPGGYALAAHEVWPPFNVFLNVDPITGDFTSPVVAPGEYSLAHGDHSQGHLTNNDAARVQVTAGQTADAGTVRVQQPGQITGTVADSAGRPLSGVAVSGRVSSESSTWSMPYSPFNTSGSASFWANTSDDGTYTAQNLYPDDGWQIEIEIPKPHEFTAIAAGGHHSCAVRTDQTIACWGNNAFDQAYPPEGQHTAIAAGEWHSCAIRTDQTIACWGHNELGQTDAPDGQYIAVDAGGNHSCAIKTDNTIACWGHNWDGQADLPAGKYTAIAAGHSHSCAIRADQTITCSGRDVDGLIDAPQGQYTAIAAGDWHSCAIRPDQTIACWGRSERGHPRLPGGTYTVTDAPEGNYTAIAVGGAHSCAIRADQTITCWGGNASGQSDSTDGQYTAITAGGSHSCAINADQAVACWGDNFNGQARGPRQSYFTASSQGIAVASGGTVVCDVVWNEAPGVTCSSSQTETDDETASEEETPAERCFAVHKFGAQPVDVAKTADRETVLAQLSWGFHESIGCYLTLDEAALGVLQAAPAPAGFPAADPAVSQQCFDVHKFGAQPVDVAKTPDRQTVLAQVRWGFHQSIGCYLTLDTTATAALRAAHT